MHECVMKHPAKLGEIWSTFHAPSHKTPLYADNLYVYDYRNAIGGLIQGRHSSVSASQCLKFRKVGVKRLTRLYHINWVAYSCCRSNYGMENGKCPISLANCNRITQILISKCVYALPRSLQNFMQFGQHCGKIWACVVATDTVDPNEEASIPRFNGHTSAHACLDKHKTNP